MTNQEIANHIFARNPKTKRLYCTSDGQAFYEKHHAEAHSQRLADQEVTPHHRVVNEAISEAKAKIAPKKEEADKLAEAKKEETAKVHVATAEPVDVSFLEGNVTKSAEKIKEVKTAAELDAIEKAEIADKDRTGVKDAIASRRAELTENNTQTPE